MGGNIVNLHYQSKISHKTDNLHKKRLIIIYVLDIFIYLSV